MAINFSTPKWAVNGNVYEVNIRQYTQDGTFEAFATHLPRLKAMGVSILWFMPITPISVYKRLGTLGSYYACSSYTNTNPEFGSIAQFTALVKQAHALGMKVIIDWVANHTGADHEWCISNPDYYFKNELGHFYDKNGWEDVIDLNYENVEMQNAMINSMKFWIETADIDGFRCDMAHLVPLEFWLVARKECNALKPSTYWMAETDNHTYFEAFDATYGWELMHATDKYCNGEKDFDTVKAVLDYYANLPIDCSKLLFTSNHDENSWNGTEYEKYGKYAACFAVLTCTYVKSMPLVYSGQELPLMNRLPFFDKGQIQWQENPSLAFFYEQLLNVRYQFGHLIKKDFFNIITTDIKDGFGYYFTNGNDTVLVLINFSKLATATFYLPNNVSGGNFISLFTKITYQFSKEERFVLSPADYVVYTSKN